MATKSELRDQMRRVRRGLIDHPTRSRAVCRRILDLDEVRRARRLMAFVGVRGEPDVSEVIGHCRDHGVEVALPRVVGESLMPVIVEPDTPLVVGAFGIPEATGEPIAAETIDVVLVPGLAFTPNGLRLGQGGGHFDRFLEHLPPEVVTIGVCFGEQIVDDLPIEPHDRPVDIVVTDRAAFRAGGDVQSSS